MVTISFTLDSVSLCMWELSGSKASFPVQWCPVERETEPFWWGQAVGLGGEGGRYVSFLWEANLISKLPGISSVLWFLPSVSCIAVWGAQESGGLLVQNPTFGRWANYFSSGTIHVPVLFPLLGILTTITASPVPPRRFWCLYPQEMQGLPSY